MIEISDHRQMVAAQRAEGLLFGCKRDRVSDEDTVLRHHPANLNKMQETGETRWWHRLIRYLLVAYIIVPLVISGDRCADVRAVLG